MSDLQVTQRLAAGLLAGVIGDLELAASPRLPAEERLMYASRAWSSWARACAAMAELETLMPRSALAGFDRAARIGEIIDGQVA